LTKIKGYGVDAHTRHNSNIYTSDEIKTERFELNKFHASKKDPFY
jgi:hypothetical protein